jgi:diguanylate cyclase (GGDEF)-like protein
MRAITGWRFLVYIAIPLVLASLGAINLSYDLLRRVEAGSNSAEQQRNATIMHEAVKFEVSELERIAIENARWDDAYENTQGTPNQNWFYSTWGKSISIGVSYDVVAVLDVKSGQVLIGQDHQLPVKDPAPLLGDLTLASLEAALDPAMANRGVVSGFVQTSMGPTAVALAPIVPSADANKKPERILYFARRLNDAWLAKQQTQLLIGGLHIVKAGETLSRSRLPLQGINGQPVFDLRWRNRDLGNLVTSTSWNKVGLVLAFLVLVMTGIGYVCWRLVQQLVEDERKAQHNALHDHLTGLPNRAALVAEMQSCFDKGEQYALAFADLDGFKEVNDNYGHECGDKLIQMISGGITQLAKEARISSRLGGDEFVIMFAGENSQVQAKAFANHLIAMLKMPFDMDGRLASVGASLGIVQSEPGHDVTEVLRRSDIAMYRAKTTGKNRFCVFDDSFDAERVENLSIIAELKTILAARNLDIMFQPVVSARTGQITGVEALARWPKSSPRQVSADKFIALAENTGLIDQLGELILDRACIAAASWPQLRLAVNISAVQLNNPGFVKRVLDTLARHKMLPSRIELEITETSLINDTERAKEVFKAFQKAGIKVALDDFGTGFSSIGYLRTFQFDRIKIDKSIVNKVLSSPAELAVVQGTLLVARGLSADVTAEGVESSEEASVLRLAGCTELQGYYYHKPMTAADVTETLRRTGIAHVPRSVVVA